MSVIAAESAESFLEAAMNDGHADLISNLAYCHYRENYHIHLRNPLTILLTIRHFSRSAWKNVVVHPIKGNGSCFFECLEIALKSSTVQRFDGFTVEKLRELIAEDFRNNPQARRAALDIIQPWLDVHRNNLAKLVQAPIVEMMDQIVKRTGGKTTHPIDMHEASRKYTLFIETLREMQTFSMWDASLSEPSDDAETMDWRREWRFAADLLNPCLNDEARMARVKRRIMDPEIYWGFQQTIIQIQAILPIHLHVWQLCAIKPSDDRRFYQNDKTHAIEVVQPVYDLEVASYLQPESSSSSSSSSSSDGERKTHIHLLFHQKHYVLLGLKNASSKIQYAFDYGTHLSLIKMLRVQCRNVGEILKSCHFFTD